MKKTFSEELIVVGNIVDGEERKWGFIDKTGNVIIPFKYDLLSSYEFYTMDRYW